MSLVYFVPTGSDTCAPKTKYLLAGTFTLPLTCKMFLKINKEAFGRFICAGLIRCSSSSVSPFKGVLVGVGHI